MNILSFSCLLALASVCSSIAPAQSFDCSKAAEAHEKFICANRDLSAADTEMAAVYNSMRSQLSAEGKNQLAETQRLWLKYGRNRTALKTDDMKSSYRGRIEELKKTIQTVGPFRFEALTIYYAPPARKQPARNDDSEPTLGNIDFTFLRVDSPVSADTTRWNKLVEEHISGMAKSAGVSIDNQSLISSGKLVVVGSDLEMDISIDSTVVFASQDLISVALHTMTYAQGAAHPNHEMAGYTVLLKSGRELAASDLFEPQRQWKTGLARLVLAKLKTGSQQDGSDLQVSSAEDIVKLTADTRRWTISKSGLVVTFSPYEVGSYASGAHEAVVSWQELKPYLKSPPPFPIPLP